MYILISSGKNTLQNDVRKAKSMLIYKMGIDCI